MNHLAAAKLLVYGALYSFMLLQAMKLHVQAASADRSLTLTWARHLPLLIGDPVTSVQMHLSQKENHAFQVCFP